MPLGLEACCVACGSKNLCFGTLGTSASNVFIPSGIFTVHGYKTRSYTCLDCGYVNQYLPKDRLDKLKEKLRDRLKE